MTVEAESRSKPDTQLEVLFREAHLRRRRRRTLVGAGILVFGLGVVAYVLTSSGGTAPPARGTPGLEAPLSLTPHVVGKPVSTRSIDGWTLRIFASSSGLPLEKVKATYELVDPRGTIDGWGSTTLGLALSPGVVLTGTGGSGTWTVSYFVVTTPEVSLTRVVSGSEVLDSMVPVSFTGVRFVLLVVRGTVPQDAVVQGLNSSGSVVSTDRYSFPPAPSSSGTGSVKSQGTSGGGYLHSSD